MLFVRFFYLYRAKHNLAKNRYTDVLCFDHSRVILPTIDDDPTTDYINANFVDGYKQKNAYISTQGEFSALCCANSFFLYFDSVSVLKWHTDVFFYL